MCFGAGRSEKLLFFARPMLKIFDAAPLALDEGSVRGFDVCPLVKAREIVCAPIGEKLVDGFGIVFAAKHGGAFEAHVSNGEAVLFHTPQAERIPFIEKATDCILECGP